MTSVLDSGALGVDLEEHRVALTGYCYRMLGSGTEAEDAVQETMLRAWRSQGQFEGWSSLRSWLFRIATNVCFDLLTARARRARPMDLRPSSFPNAPIGEPLADSYWLGPIADLRVVPEVGDPAELVTARESVRLAFVATLQLLPPRQRAVLVLRDVLCWPAAEVAGLLDTTTASVNSALQRARATLADWSGDLGEPIRPQDPAQRDLLERYVTAFTTYDIDALVKLLHADAVMSMPPLPLWLRGAETIGTWLRKRGAACARSRMIPMAVNGSPGFAQWRLDDDGEYRPWGIQVLEIRDGLIIGVNAFLDTERLWPLFALSEGPPTEAPIEA
jgi:RNA polymerase sigma-70 factor (ECF subfamily)